MVVSDKTVKLQPTNRLDMDIQSVSSVAVIRVLVFARRMRRFGTIRGRMLRS